MPSTYNKIQTVTVGSGGSSTIQFTNIPQTFTDLKILISGRGTSVDTDFFVTFNGNSAATYNYVQMYGYVTGNGADRGSNQTSLNVGVTSGASSSSANAFSANEINILNYSLSTQNKAVGSLNVTENNGQVAYLNMKQGHWANTSAITSLSLACSNGNWAEYTSATLYGINKIGSQIADTVGATVSTDGTYYYYTFLGSGSFTPLINTSVDYLVVAGGGGGGARGGGGAGGLRCTVGATGGGGSLESKLALTANTSYTVTVGAGGAGGINTGSPVNAASGTNSVFGSITSTGGGNGAGDSNYTQAAGNGGSGGGASATSGTASTAGTGTANQGYAGGTTSGGTGGGGGGGAGAVGSNGSANTGGNGGAGVASSISGTSVTRAGGGGGAGNTTGGSGGSGGGGAGVSNTGTGGSGTVNTGSGGGGCTALGTNTAGAGGSGIVIIRVGV